jgi:hypothetical protein
MTGRAVVVAFVAGCLLATTSARSQTPSRDPAAPQASQIETASIGGIVLQEGPANTPLRRATVIVRHSERLLIRTVVSDDAGRFLATELPAGRYTLSVSKASYVAIAGPRTQPTTVTVAEGARHTTTVLRLARGAAITGRVVDHVGQPMRGAGIIIAERRQVGTQIITRNVPSAGGSVSVTTNDLGIYRAFGLPAGSYVVAVTPPASVGSRLPTAAELQWVRGPRPNAIAVGPPPGPAVVHAAVYYPATTNIGDATAVTVAAGDERAGVDITLELVPTTEISGRVTWEDGSPVRNAQVLALPRVRPVVSTGAGLFPRVSPTGADGRFVVSGLVPGAYTITARAAQPSPVPGARGVAGPATAPPAAAGRGGAAVGPDFWGSAEISAAGQRIDELILVLKPGLRVAGRLAVESTTSPVAATDFSKASVSVASVADSAATIRVSARGIQPDGSFVLEGLLPGAYSLTSSMPATDGRRLVLKSAIAAGRDVYDAPLELRADVGVVDLVITFTDRVSELSGRVTDKLDRPVREYYILAFSTDRTHWRPESRRLSPPQPTPEGRYVFSGLPPGQYYVAAVPEYERAIWNTPEYLEQVVPGAITVTIGDGEKKTQDIKLGI